MLRKQMPRLLFHPPFEGNLGFSGGMGGCSCPGAGLWAPWGLPVLPEQLRHRTVQPGDGVNQLLQVSWLRDVQSISP